MLERPFKLWINSLGIPGVKIVELTTDLQSGVVLCSIVDDIQAGAINWRYIEKKPKNDFGRSGNCGKALEGTKKLGLKSIGVGGHSVSQGDQKDILAIVWSLMKFTLLNRV